MRCSNLLKDKKKKKEERQDEAQNFGFYSMNQFWGEKKKKRESEVGTSLGLI